MLRRLFRQRRRFVSIAMLISIWLVIGVLTNAMPAASDLPTGSWIAWVAIALTGLLVSGAVTLIGTFVIPSMRFVAETLFLTLFSVTLLQIALPAAQLQTGWISMLTFVTAYIVIERLLYFTPLDRWTIRPVPLRERSFDLPITPHAAWNAFAPLPELAKTHFYPGTKISPVVGRDDVFEITYP